METLKERDVSKLTRTELRKQKLAEYLAQKGRLKPPNPKPYLKDSTVLKKSGEGKENQVTSAMGAKKDMKTENMFIKNKNGTTTKLELRTMSTAPSAVSAHQHLTCRPGLSQTGCHYSRMHSNGTTFVRNAPLKQIETKAQTNTGVGLQQSKAAKTDARTPFGTSSHRTHGHPAKTDFSRKGKESGLHKTASVSVVKCSTKQPTNSVQKKVGTISKTMTSKQIRLTQNGMSKTSVIGPDVTHGQDKRYGGSVQFKESLKCKSQAKPAKMQPSQNESLFLGTHLNKAGSKSGPTHPIHRSSAMMRPALPLASSKTIKATRPAGVNVARDRSAVPQQPGTAQHPSNATLHAPVPKTVPRNSKSSSQARGTGQPKTPKTGFNPGTQGVRTVPLDCRKKLTAAQEERQRKLEEWRKSRGITYKRPPMPVQPVKKKTSASPHNYWTSMEHEDEVHGFVCAVDQSLNDCIQLIQQGCSVDQVRDVLSRVPMAQKFAKYWICQVRLMERDGDFDVLPTFEEAVRSVRESVDELRSVVFEILKRKEAEGSSSSRIEEGEAGDEEETRYSMCTPKPVSVQIHGEKGESSIIKYKITATPSGKRDQQKIKPGRVNGHEIRFFTPVRRSLRIEKTAPRFPAALQEHDPCVTSLRHLLPQGADEDDRTHVTETRDSMLYVYRENEALKEQVHIRLIYDEAAG
ncbi:cytoskeleton-associated protein 2-like [Brachyhypopomus gauderio]|uniref:cytoskeleton-associated protein 2-like n=1 Tax=Brachyhypopomus gauderio TaxID=698409 RepID=UPI004041B2B2